jgi:hypothetical protein
MKEGIVLVRHQAAKQLGAMGVFKKWQTYWLTLYGGFFWYTQDPMTCTAAERVVFLQNGAAVIPTVSPTHKNLFCFKVTSGTSEVKFAVKTEIERDQWIALIKANSLPNTKFNSFAVPRSYTHTR